MMTTKGIFKEAWQLMKGNWGLGIGVSLLATLMIAGAAGVGAFLPFVGSIAASILVTGPLMMGLYWLFLGLVDKKRHTSRLGVDNLFDGFRDYGRVLAAGALHYVIILGWTLISLIGLIPLFVGIFYDSVGLIVFSVFLMLILLIPVIIATLSYSQYYYILKDEPTITASAALKKSRQLMQGNKGKYFLMQLLMGLAISVAAIPMIIGYIILFAGVMTPPFGNEALILTGLIILGLGALLIIPVALFASPFMYACYAAFYRRLVPYVNRQEDEINGQPAAWGEWTTGGGEAFRSNLPPQQADTSQLGNFLDGFSSTNDTPPTDDQTSI